MAEKTRNRAEFTSKTRELIAQRAGYRCSFPNCDRITVGPNKHPDKSSIIGVAAHIYGAATSGGGPRGTGGLTEDEIQSLQNAIWLCGNHASLIDKHGGEDYPPEKLFSYKASHEARIAHELTGIHTPFGWVDKMRVNSSPLFAEKIEFDFAKLTLITANNSVGKTALCEWFAAVTNVQYSERWSTVPKGRKKLFIEVDYHNPEQHKASVSFLSDKHPEYKLDDTTTTIPTAPLKILFPQYIHIPIRNDSEQDDLKLISDALNLHPYEIRALCDDVATNGSDYVKSAWFEENDEHCYLFADVEGSELRPCCFRLLSHSQRERILMELGIIAANRFATMNPTVLILDAGFRRLDTDWLRLYADFLGSPACNFQTIASINKNRINLNDLTWAGWKIIRLEGEPPNVMISTDVR